MLEQLERLSELIRRANVANNSPGSWITIQPDGTATYAGHMFPNIAEMLVAIMELAGANGEPQRVYKSAGGFPEPVKTTCCALPGATAWECQWHTNGKTYCRCKCHNHTKVKR